MKASPAAWSLSGSLGWRLAAVMVIGVLLAAFAVAWRAVATINDIDDTALQSQARLIAAQLPSDAAGTERISLPDSLVAPFRSSDGDNVFLVYKGDHPVAASDPVAAASLAPLLPRPLRDGFFRVPPFAGHKHGMVGLLTQAGPWRVMVLQGREQTGVLLDSLMDSFADAAIWLLVPIGLATIFVGVMTLRRGLRPLRRVSAAAAMIGRPGSEGERLPTAALPAEIAPLVQAMNDALARLEQALTAQRRFMAEEAHALRTPLAVMTARLDLLNDRDAVEPLRHDTDRMARLVGQLLRMARLEGLPLDTTQRVVLRAAAVEAIASLVPIGLQKEVEIALQEASGVMPVRGNHAALVLAVVNLVENALSHAPRGSEIEVAITPPATVTVLDRGPGVPPEHRTRIFGRFERGAASREGGAGLGLAIVAEIAAAHGGTARVTDREGGGAAFVLDLDAAALRGDEKAGPSKLARRGAARNLQPASSAAATDSDPAGNS